MAWNSLWRQGSALTLGVSIACACDGQIQGRAQGDGGSIAPGAGKAGGAGAGASVSGSGNDGAGLDDAGVPSAPVIPFDALSVPASVTKVKNLLTGLAPTQTEIDAVTSDPSALGGLVDSWMQLPEYAQKMEVFFADAFQQSQASQTSFKTVIDDGTFSPNDGLLLNFRQSFAKTMTELIKEGHPFNEAATTTSYMMTTAMMAYYAYSDASMLTDATASSGGDMHNRFYDADKNWT